MPEFMGAGEAGRASRPRRTFSLDTEDVDGTSQGSRRGSCMVTQTIIRISSTRDSWSPTASDSLALPTWNTVNYGAYGGFRSSIPRIKLRGNSTAQGLDVGSDVIAGAEAVVVHTAPLAVVRDGVPAR